MGVNTAQTNYNLYIYRNIFYPDTSTSSALLQYRNNIDPEVVIVNSTTEDPTSYKFYSENLTLHVENFSVPSPQNVRGVKFMCEFSVISQGRLISAVTTMAVIPGFCKYTTSYLICKIAFFGLNLFTIPKHTVNLQLSFHFYTRFTKDYKESGQCHCHSSGQQSHIHGGGILPPTFTKLLVATEWYRNLSFRFALCNERSTHLWKYFKL